MTEKRAQVRVHLKNPDSGYQSETNAQVTVDEWRVIDAVLCGYGQKYTAAPDLLEACRAGAEVLEQYVHALHHMPSEQLEAHPYIPTVEDAFDALHAAIAKATQGAPHD